jgi:hypothetical protein
MARRSLLLVVRGLGLALILTLVLVHVATPRTYVTPGDALTPSGPTRQASEAASERKGPSDGVERPGNTNREEREPMGRRGLHVGAGRFGTD